MLIETTKHMHLQAITTKFFGPGNVRGVRIKATAAAGSVTLGADHRLDSQANHDAAAFALANKLHWLEHGETLLSGGLSDGSGNVYMIVSPRGVE